jgi:hypothetical protein
MLQVKNSVVNTVSGALLTGVIAITSVTNCEAVNSISPTFITSDTTNCVSGDTSGNIVSLTPDYLSPSIGDYRIRQSWADTNLVGVGYDASDIASWAYLTPLDELGFTHIHTIKFPAITGTITGGVWRIRYEDIPTEALAQLKYDGSDLRITTDALGGNTPLPIDIASFNKVVDGIDIRLKADGATDSMLYLWGNNPNAVQPLATDVSGSKAVWADEISSLILMDGTSALTDRAGNVNDWRYTGSGGLSYSVNGTTLGADRMVASSSLYQTLVSDKTYHYRFIANVTAIATDSTLIKIGSSEVRQNGSGNDFRIQFTNGARTAGSGFLTSFPTPTGMTVYDLVFDGGTHRLYKDGVQVWWYTYGVAMDWDATAYLFNHMTLVLQGLSISNETLPVDRIVAEASNLSAVGAWWIAADEVSSDQQISAILSGGGVQNLSFDITKLIASITSSNGISTSQAFTGRLASTPITAGGTATASAIQGLLVSITSAVSAGGDVTSIPEIDKLVQLLATSGGNISYSLSVDKALQQPVLTANGQVTLDTEVGKLLPTVVSGGGTLDQFVTVSSNIVSSITGAGIVTNTTSVAKQLNTLISAGGSVETIALQLAGTLSRVTAGGSVSNTILYSKNSTITNTSNGNTVTLLEVGKTLESLLSTSGIIESVLAKNVDTTANTQGDGEQVLALSRGSSLSSFIEANGLVTSLASISKIMQTTESANTSGVLIDFSKGIPTATTIGAAGDLVSSVSINANLLTIVSADGDPTTLVLGNFTDTNIIYAALESIATETSITIISVVEGVVS